jgi:hypothetical protein
MVLPGCLAAGRAQAPQNSLASYIGQAVVDAGQVDSVTIDEWKQSHPEDSTDVQAAFQAPDQSNAGDQRLIGVEGQWCMRASASDVSLENGVTVKRVALFDPPQVENLYPKPIPPLPTETGDALRRHGCRLHRLLYEFTLNGDPQALAKCIATLLPWDQAPLPPQVPPQMEAMRIFWASLYEFSLFRPATTAPHIGQAWLAVNPGGKWQWRDVAPAVLLAISGGLEYGEPSGTIDPEAGQTWLALRAAMLARQPLGATLAMLQLLAPERGDRGEQPPFHCSTQLLPPLREWMRLANASDPAPRAAALLVADQALVYRLGECAEYPSGIPYMPPQPGDARFAAYDTLMKGLHEMGITMKRGRDGEWYSGNLTDKALALAPSGPVNELGRIAVLDDRCSWASDLEWPGTVISIGEKTLTDFPSDEWTPNLHLIVAGAYASAWNLGSSISSANDSSAPPAVNEAWRKKAEMHYRAWYAQATSDRDRALVWEEIWALAAGMQPRLSLGFCGVD